MPESKMEVAATEFFARDFAWGEGRPILQGHQEYCEIYGHAACLVGGVFIPNCPRCGAEVERELVSARTETTVDRLVAFQKAIDAANVVAEVVDELIDPKTGDVHADYLGGFRTRDVGHALAALDKVVKNHRGISLDYPGSVVDSVLVEVVEQARAASGLIRQAIGQL